jgi:hypothetical protein
MEQFFGHSIDTLRCCTYLAAMLCATGRFLAAREHLATAEVWAKDSAQTAYVGLYHLMCAIAGLFAADWVSAISYGELSCDYSAKEGQAMHHYMALDVMAWSKSHLGRHEEALATRAEAAALRRPLGRTLGEDWFEAGEAEILLDAGRVEEAAEKARIVIESSRAANLFHSLAVAERVAGCAKGLLGGPRDEIEAHLRESLVVCEKHEMVVHAAQTELRWGRLCRTWGDDRAAEEHVAKALASLDGGGYDHARDWARKLAGEP